MAYQITQFGTTAVPSSAPAQEIGAGEAVDGAVSVAGGRVHDAYGTARAPIQLPFDVEVSASLRTPTGLATWAALVGTRGRLYRTVDGGALNAQSTAARLRSVRSTRTVEGLSLLPISMLFQVLEHPWAGADATVNDVLDASPKALACANGGNAPVRNAVITVTAAGSAITVLQVGVAGISLWAWTGTLAVGQALVIDCGAKTVRNNGVDAYSGFALDALHTIADWLRLEAGANTVQVWRTGGDNTTAIRIAYAAGWA